MTPKLSICIPSYNNAQFLPELFESILNQSFKDFELIFVDDCSTDKSIAVVRGFNDPRIKVFENKKNVGVVGNMNRCLLQAKGDYITIIGSDDALAEDSLKKRVTFLDQNPDIGFVCS